MLTRAPKINMPKRAKGQSLARSRPVTLEEFERMLDKVPAGWWTPAKPGGTRPSPRSGSSSTRPSSQAPSRWQRGAGTSAGYGCPGCGWRSPWSYRGTRANRSPWTCQVAGQRFGIYGEAQKSGRDELLPMAPDFAQFIQETAEHQRCGKVFKLIGPRSGRPLAPADVGEAIRRIGRKAGVVVNKADGKYATAHDLRRAFGTSWAKRVMPAVLKRLMRHSSINTTMAYYVDLEASEVADDLWDKFGGEEAGNTSGNTGPKNANGSGNPEPASHSVERT